MVTVSGLAVLTVLSALGMGALGLIAWWKHDGSGLTAFFILMLGGMVGGLAYGLNLVTFDERTSVLLEIPYWVASELILIGLFFFALAFTGRGQYLTRRNAFLLSVVPLVTMVVATTNALGYHTLFWTNYGIAEAHGAAVRTFDRGPWLYVKTTYAVILAGIAYLVLLEEVYTERTLFRQQSIALVLGGVVPFSGYLVWLLELGPAPHVDFLTPMYWFAVLLYGYAIFHADLFETTPAVRRLGRQHTIDNVNEGIVIVAADGTVTDLNDAAAEVLNATRTDVLGEPLDAYVPGESFDLDREHQTLSTSTNRGRREFDVVTSPMKDGSGSLIGYTLLFHDVTDRNRREQRLSVLNRVLRHNLRNDLNVVVSRIEVASDGVESERRESLAVAREKAMGLVELGEQARDIEGIIESETKVGACSLTEVVESVVAELQAEFPNASFDVAGANVTINTRRDLVVAAVENVLENAVVHDEGPDSTVTIGVEATTDGGIILVEDEGPGIPDHEIRSLERTETPLEHGSGLGLWLVRWATERLGGEVTFDASPDGTTVVLSIPDREES